MNNSQQVLGTESIGKLLLKYSVPAIIGMMVNALYNVVDRMFIGNIPGVGPLAITGLGVTMPIMTIILAFGIPLAKVMRKELGIRGIKHLKVVYSKEIPNRFNKDES